MAAMRDVGALETRIKAAPDADALRAIVAELGVVHGSQGKLYTSEELLEHIETALRVPELANQVTRTLGLRAWSFELFRNGVHAHLDGIRWSGQRKTEPGLK